MVALVDERLLQLLNRAAAEQERLGKSRRGAVLRPWDTFRHDLNASVQGMVVSWRMQHRTRGSLHQESAFGVSGRNTDGQPSGFKIRIPIGKFKPEKESDFDGIVNGWLRKQLLRRWLQNDKSMKLFGNPANCGFDRNGRPVIVNRMVVLRSENPLAFGPGEHSRFHEPGSNHHLAVYSVLGKDGKEKKWAGQVIRTTEAIHRKAAGEQIVRGIDDGGSRLLFHLRQWDAVELSVDGAAPKVFVVRKFSQEVNGSVKFGVVLSSQSRAEDTVVKTFGNLRKWKCRKVEVSPIGEVTTSHD